MTLEQSLMEGLVQSYGGYSGRVSMSAQYETDLVYMTGPLCVVAPAKGIRGRGSTSGQVLERFLVRQDERRAFNLQ